MKDIEKEDIEQLMRDLYTYGYFSSKIKLYDVKLQEIQRRIRDCYEVSGISYDKPMGTRDSYYSKTTQLIHEEGEVLAEKRNILCKRNALQIEEKIQVLDSLEQEILVSIFFHKHTHAYVSNMVGLTREGVTKKIWRSLHKMLKSS